MLRSQGYISRLLGRVLHQRLVSLEVAGAAGPRHVLDAIIVGSLDVFFFGRLHQHALFKQDVFGVRTGAELALRVEPRMARSIASVYHVVPERSHAPVPDHRAVVSVGGLPGLRHVLGHQVPEQVLGIQRLFKAPLLALEDQLLLDVGVVVDVNGWDGRRLVVKSVGGYRHGSSR